jgi:hypothetical protein
MAICTISCAISSIFIIGMIYMTLSIDKTDVSKKFMDTLDNAQQEKYRSLVRERLQIYYGGYILGFILSMGVIFMNMYNKKKMTPLSMMCLTGAISFLTTYFYYILSPKSDYIVKYLFKKDQREAWLNVYRTMQFHYHGGLALGLLAVIGFSYAFC